MAISGGDILEATASHPTLGTFSFFCKSGEDAVVDPGGIRTDDDEQMITGAGDLIQKKSRTQATAELPPISWDMGGQNELFQLKQLAGSSELADWTIACVNGNIWGGKGLPVGDIKGNINTAQIEGVKLAFQNELEILT